MGRIRGPPRALPFARPSGRRRWSTEAGTAHPPAYMASELRSISAEKPQDSRDEILKAGIRLFARRGFHETSMSEVARDAKVSKALIFWHFKTKEELFLAVLNRLLEPYFIDFAEEVGVLDERASCASWCTPTCSSFGTTPPPCAFFLAKCSMERRCPTNWQRK